jgi:hypothetical protein
LTKNEGEIMPIITVWGLPSNRNFSARGLTVFADKIIAAVLGIDELRLKRPSDVTCFFPAERVTDELINPVVVQITGLFEKPERTPMVLDLLATRVGTVVKAACPDTKVEVFIFPYNPKATGFFSSE